MKKKRRLKKEVKLMGLILAILSVISVLAFILLNNSPLKLTATSIDVGYNESIDYYSYIKENDDLDIDSVVIKTDEVRTNELGTYKVYYQYKNKTKELEVNIKDLVSPLIKENEIVLTLHSDVNLLDRISVSDDYTSEPIVTIDESTLDRSKVGTYEVKVEAKDESGNTANSIIKVKVVEPDHEDLKVIYLTFDDGPSPVTEKVLDVLKKYNVKATFFVCGENGVSGVKKYGEFTKRAASEGHTIALHSYTHNYKKIYKNNDAFMADIKKLSDAVEDLVGYAPKYIRFPGGTTNGYCDDINSLIKIVHSHGYEYFDWNVSSGDAAKATVDTKKIISNSTKAKYLKYKKINLLMHDMYTKSTTAEALPAIIEHYLENGYEFRAIDDSAYLAQFK